MISKLFLKSLAKPALNVALVLFLIAGCSSSTTPTYSKKNIKQSIRNICRKEYRIDVTVNLIGDTLWIYMPVKDLLEISKQPEKITEKFSVEECKEEFSAGKLRVGYLIRNIPEKEKYQSYKYNKKVLEKIGNTWKVLRRVMFSMERAESSEPKFYCLVTADIKNGIELREVSYYLDLKKFSYGFISAGEYQHRAIQDINISTAIIGDIKGRHINYRDIDLKDFLPLQIDQRIRLKFLKPEVGKNADVDKEIAKIVTYTLKAYDFKDFSSVELENLFTNNKIVLGRKEIWQKSAKKSGY